MYLFPLDTPFPVEINNKTLIMLVVGGEVGYFHGDGRQTTLLEGK